MRDFSQDAASGVRPAWRGKFMAFTQQEMCIRDRCSSYRAAGTPSCSRCFRVDAMAASCTSKPTTFPSGAVMPHRKAVSPPLPQVASMQRRGCASRAARKSCTNLTAVRSGVRPVSYTHLALPLKSFTVLVCDFANWADTAPLPCLILKK